MCMHFRASGRMFTYAVHAVLLPAPLSLPLHLPLPLQLVQAGLQLYDLLAQAILV